MNLIPHWKSSWRMFSQQAFAGIIALQTVGSMGTAKDVFGQIVAQLPPEVATSPVVTHFVSVTTSVLGILGIVGRVMSQKSVCKAETDAKEKIASESRFPDTVLAPRQ